MSATISSALLRLCYSTCFLSTVFYFLNKPLDLFECLFPNRNFVREAVSMFLSSPPCKNENGMTQIHFWFLETAHTPPPKKKKRNKKTQKQPSFFSKLSTMKWKEVPRAEQPHFQKPTWIRDVQKTKLTTSKKRPNNKFTSLCDNISPRSTWTVKQLLCLSCLSTAGWKI